MGEDVMTQIRTINPAHYNIPMRGNPALHRNLEWYATDDNKVLGVVILDLIDKDYSWVVLTDTPEDVPGYCAVDMKASLHTMEEARRELRVEMLNQHKEMK